MLGSKIALGSLHGRGAKQQLDLLQLPASRPQLRQLPRRTPFDATPFTRVIPLANSGASSALSAASTPSLAEQPTFDWPFNAVRMAELVIALDEWIRNGGFLPQGNADNLTLTYRFKPTPADLPRRRFVSRAPRSLTSLARGFFIEAFSSYGRSLENSSEFHMTFGPI